MKPSPTYISFLVRMWREKTAEQSEPAGDWQGEVEHIQSGRKWQFNNEEALTRFLSNPLARIEPAEEPKEDRS